MKKLLVLVICISLMISTASYGKIDISYYSTEDKFGKFDDYEILFENEAKMMYELGLFDGISQDEYVPDLENKTNREQTFKMLAVALNWKINKNAESQFDDVSPWAQPYVAKAVELGVTNGIGNGKFGGSDPITLRQLNTLLLRSIGYDSTKAWEGTSEYARREFRIDYRFNHADLELNRDKLVGNIYAAIKNGEPLGKDYTLLEKLAYDNEELQKVAINHELISPNYKMGNSLLSEKTDELYGIEEFAPYMVENNNTKHYIEDVITYVATKPLEIQVGYKSKESETLYDYPEIIDDISYITYICRFGKISITKGENSFYISNFLVEESGYFHLYGAEIGKPVNDSHELYEANKLEVIDGWFSYDTQYTNLYSQELDVSIDLYIKYDYNEDLRCIETIKKLVISNNIE